jgi:UDP-N-acetylglucosamine enolpyruvyl transferase
MIIWWVNLIGTQISSCDLRAGATCVLAWIMGKWVTEVLWIDYIERWYENFDKKLKWIWVNIERV